MMAWFPWQVLRRSSVRSPVAALMLLASIPAGAADHFLSRSNGLACVDPLATLALRGNPPRHAHASSWRREVRRRGRCFAVAAGERWEWIAGAEPHLLLLRREKPRAGEPPLYFSSNLMLPDTGSRSPAHVQTRHVAVAAHRRHAVRDTTPLPARTYAAKPPVASPPDAPMATTEPSAKAALPAALQAAPNRGAPAAANPIAAPASDPAVPATAPALSPGASAALIRSEKIGRAIGLFLFFGLLAGIAALTAFVTWRLRARNRAARASEADASEAAIATTGMTIPAAAGSRPTQDRRVPAGANGAPIQDVFPEPAETGPPPVVARTAPAPGALADYKSRCASMLRLAGWDARTRHPGGTREADVVARRGTHLLALRCHLSPDPVDVQAVEDACLARERQRSDLAAIVSGSRYTEAARQLADRTGVVLLRDHELASFGT